MQNCNYEFRVKNPNFENLYYIKATANLDEKHDRSAPSNYHWKVLKCRMIIFSNSSILASPDKNDVKQIHVIFNKLGGDYDKVNSLFLKFSLSQNGEIQKTTPVIFQMCFEYTLIAKLAPSWNILGSSYLINNRDFLTATEPQDGVQFKISSNETVTKMELKPIKINILRSDDDYMPGEWIRVLPSLFKATIDDVHTTIPASGKFKCYKDLKRHWKNIHGYRLPEEEGQYCTVQFWRGDPLTYPKLCILRNFPIIIPIPKAAHASILKRFIGCLQSKMSSFLGEKLKITTEETSKHAHNEEMPSEKNPETQAVSLCTPTQHPQTHL